MLHEQIAAMKEQAPRRHDYLLLVSLIENLELVGRVFGTMCHPDNVMSSLGRFSSIAPELAMPLKPDSSACWRLLGILTSRT